MAATIDLSKFTFCGDQLRAVNEMTFEDSILKAPAISDYSRVWTGIRAQGEVGFIGEGQPIGEASQGCDPTYKAWQIATNVMKWDPKEWGFYIKMCYKDLENTAAVYSLNFDGDVSNFTDSDYMNIVNEALTTALRKMFFRLIWFGDTDAQNVSSGVITSGVSPTLFTVIDGFWKQINTLITGDQEAQHTATISENAGASYAAQALSPDNVVTYLQNVIMNAPIGLRLLGPSRTELLVTQSVYDAYTLYLQGKGISDTYRNLVDGQPSLSYNGYRLVAMPLWDEMINAFENNGTKLNNPHRILFTTKEVLAVGVASTTSFDQFKVFHDDKDMQVYARGVGMLDAKIARANMFSVGI